MFNLIFHKNVKDEIMSFDKKTLVALDKLEKQGYLLRYPHTKPINNGLFELRVTSKNATRTFFVFAKNKNIFVLRSFIKKSNKTPHGEIELALNRLKELENEQAKN